MVTLVLVMVGNGALLLRETEAWKVIQRMKNHWLLPTAVVVIGLVILAGLVVWAQPEGSILSPIADAKPNRYSELGAAMAGGAIIAGTVLVTERLFAREAEDRAAKFQESLQKDSSEFQEGLQQETLRFQVSLEKDVSGIDLREQDLSKSYWHEKIVKSAYLTKAQLNESYLRGCNFRSTYLHGVNFSGAHLREADFFGSHLGGANFEEADLTRADLRAFLKAKEDPLKRDETFGEVKLAGANLDRTNVKGADLRAVVGIEEIENLGTLKWDELTRWPGGEQPEGLGPATPG